MRELRRVTGGYTNARRCIVELDDGRTAFLKEAVDDRTAGWLRTEVAAYERLGEQPWLARVLDASGERLLLEDLSDAHWPPPWRPGDVERAIDSLDAIHDTPSDRFPSLDDLGTRLDWWSEVAADPGPLLALGLCSAAWLDAALPVLLAADRRDRLEGTALCHNDFRSDNVCFREDGTAVVVDWNWATSGNAAFDAVSWLPSLVAEGGTPPAALYDGADPSLVTMLAGLWAHHAPADPPFPGSTLREHQRRLLAFTLRWAAERLGLSPPEPPGP